MRLTTIAVGLLLCALFLALALLLLLGVLRGFVADLRLAGPWLFAGLAVYWAIGWIASRSS